LDPTRIKDSRSPEVVWTQTLANARDKLAIDFNRRINAVHLAYGEGILVCSTNAGAILGVDLLSHSLVWAHSYRKGPRNTQMDDMRRRGRGVGGGRWGGNTALAPWSNEWKAAAPAVQDGKVVFTAPDGTSIHCLDLRTGKLLWEEKKINEDVYMAGVYNGKVL